MNVEAMQKAFAETIFQTLKISTFLRRESSNYFDGEYFLGKALGFEIRIASADDNSFNDYQFWITFTSRVWIEDKSLFPNVADLVARYLTLEGYEVVRDLRCGRIEGPKLIYSRRVGENISPRDEIEVKQIN